MSFPESTRIELPILLELQATGGSEQLRFLYPRLVRYFPQLTAADLSEAANNGRNRWRALVQRAGRNLADRGELERAGLLWRLTESGRSRAAAETMRPVSTVEAPEPARLSLTHREAQERLVEIGRLLGKHAEIEYDYYDVVWRDSAVAPRLSHVFEVQVKGNLDSALAKLKHAYDTQRSKPFLVIADERDSERARRALQPLLAGSFHEIGPETVVIGAGDLERLYQALKSVAPLLTEFF